MTKVFNVPRIFAENNNVLHIPHVWISISEEYGKDKDTIIMHPGLDVLKLNFTDVTAELQDGEFTYHPISKKQALDIISFVEKYKDKVEAIYVHCYAGVSRSGAVAYALHKIYGYELHKHFWHLSEPNPFIVGRLLIAKDFYDKENSK